MQIKVELARGCGYCPFQGGGGEPGDGGVELYCAATKEEREFKYYGESDPPLWCPLREGIVEVVGVGDRRAVCQAAKWPLAGRGKQDDLLDIITTIGAEENSFPAGLVSALEDDVILE